MGEQDPPPRRDVPPTTASYQTSRRKSRVNWPVSLLVHLGREEAEDFCGNETGAWGLPTKD